MRLAEENRVERQYLVNTSCAKRATPLGLDFSIRLPESIPNARLRWANGGRERSLVYFSPMYASRRCHQRRKPLSDHTRKWSPTTTATQRARFRGRARNATSA